MSPVEMHPFEAVLRMCASAAPQPWHPQQYARRSGVPLDKVNEVLKPLWDDGLLERAAAHPEHGPGLRLSAKGWQVLNDRPALERLCRYDGVTTAAQRSARAQAVLEPLRTQRVAHVSRILLALNVFVFGVGLYLAYQQHVADAYLEGKTTPAIYAILHQIGLMTAQDWLRGLWWKTLTACFVHIGVMHILMNMYMLYSTGQHIERIWGPWRYLAIYLLAGVTGSLTGLAANPGGLAGASGALCGIFAAEGVWVLFNGRYLPPRMARDWRNHLLVNFLLLVFISFLPGISGWGHAGGAAAGAVAAVCLHYQRFGLPVLRWAALLGLLPIPLGGLYVLNHERQGQQAWQRIEQAEQALQKRIAETPELRTKEDDRRAEEPKRAETEEERFEKTYLPKIVKPLRTAHALYHDDLLAQLDRAPGERVPQTVKKNLAAIDESRKQLDELVQWLPTIEPFKAEDIGKAVERAGAYAKGLSKLLGTAQRGLEAGEQWTEDDNRELKKQEKKVAELRKAWQELLE